MLSICSDGKFATPEDAAMPAPPVSVPLAGLAPMATLIAPLNPVATLPNASSAATVAPNGVAWKTLLDGCALKASCVPAPGAIANGALVAPVRPVADASMV